MDGERCRREGKGEKKHPKGTKRGKICTGSIGTWQCQGMKGLLFAHTLRSRKMFTQRLGGGGLSSTIQLSSSLCVLCAAAAP